MMVEKKKKPQRIAKEKEVEKIREMMQSASSIIFSDYCGLDVEKICLLRRKLKEEKIDYKVVKNTLTRLAVKGEEYEENILPHLKGPTAVAFGYQDPLAALRILSAFQKENQSPKLKVGIVEKRLFSGEEIDELAKLPSYEGLLAQVVFMIKSPLQGLVNVLKGNIRSIIIALDRIGTIKEGGS
jgi:large subunit ribosomal protein L10